MTKNGPRHYPLFLVNLFYSLRRRICWLIFHFSNWVYLSCPSPSFSTSPKLVLLSGGDTSLFPKSPRGGGTIPRRNGRDPTRDRPGKGPEGGSRPLLGPESSLHEWLIKWFSLSEGWLGLP